MSFDWREYLNLAAFLQTHTGNGFAREAALRSAASRAYYAAFCHARNYARDRQRFRPSGTVADHADVIKHFRTRGDVRTSRGLERLRQWRNRCDYRDVVPNVANLVTSAIRGAQHVLDGLK